MARSRVTFQRWNHIQKTSWPFQVYTQYNEELSRFIWANDPVSKFVFSQLDKKGADWLDDPNKHFSYSPKNNNFPDLKAWSDSYKLFNKWSLLNCVMALSSNFETYLDAVISLAIESDPGLLLGTSKVIDGTILLKQNPLDKELYKKHIDNCTKGDWSSRASEFKKLFRAMPKTLNDNIGTLERMRVLRNKVGHAFGRDIESARNFAVNTILPIETISLKRLINYLKITYDVAKSIDTFLLDNHIGEYQTILAYHNLYPSLDKSIHITDRANSFKKHYGPIDHLVGKEFCKGLAVYYEGL